MADHASDPTRLTAAVAAANRETWLRRSTLVLVVLASALAMSPNVADPDLWGHVQYGRDVLAAGEIPATTSYSFTAEGYRWINHENFSEIAMAVVADGFGPVGLVVGKFLLALLVIFWIVGFNLRNGVGLVATSVITLLVAANLGYHWSVRPQLASFVCFTLLIALLQFSFTGWRDRWHLRWPARWYRASAAEVADPLGYDSRRMKWLWLAPVILVVWANSHGGFVAGVCVLSVYLGLRGVEAISRRGRAGWGLVRRMALMAAVACLATLINPYGPHLHLWLIQSLGQPRPEILDWAGVSWSSLAGLKMWPLAGVAVFALILSRRPRDFTQMVLLALTLWQATSHFRHLPFFAILVGFWIGPHLESAFVRVRRASSNDSLRIGQSPLGRWAVISITAAIGAVSLLLIQRLSDLQVRRDHFPVSAMEFMREHNLSGRMVVSYDWAQYVIAARCTDASSPISGTGRVAFDGRFRTCYPQQIVDMHFDFLYGDRPQVPRYRSPQSPPIDPARVLRYGRPELVINRRYGEWTERHMRANQHRWVLLYQDSIAQVWGIRSVYDNPLSPWYLAPHRRRVSAEIQRGSVTWPALGGTFRRDKQLAQTHHSRKDGSTQP